MLYNTSSIIGAFGFASAAPRSPYRHLELCGIALVLHGNALRYGLICRQYGKQKQVIHKTTLYLLKLSTNIRLFVCWGRPPNKGGTEFLPPKCMEKQIKLHFFAIFVDSANNIWYTFFDFERRIVFARVFQSNLPTDRPTGAGRNTDIWMPQRRAKSVSC